MTNLIVRAGSSTSATLLLGTLVADTFLLDRLLLQRQGATPTLYTYSTIPYLNWHGAGEPDRRFLVGPNYFAGGSSKAF